MFDLLLFFLFFFSSDPSTTEIYTLSLHDALPIFNRNSTTHLVGVTDRENDVLLPFLLDHVRSPEFQCRFHWEPGDRKSTRLNSSHRCISYAVFCLKKKNNASSVGLV